MRGWKSSRLPRDCFKVLFHVSFMLNNIFPRFNVSVLSFVLHFKFYAQFNFIPSNNGQRSLQIKLYKRLTKIKTSTFCYKHRNHNKPSWCSNASHLSLLMHPRRRRQRSTQFFCDSAPSVERSITSLSRRLRCRGRPVQLPSPYWTCSTVSTFGYRRRRRRRLPNVHHPSAILVTDSTPRAGVNSPASSIPLPVVRDQQQQQQQLRSEDILDEGERTIDQMLVPLPNRNLRKGAMVTCGCKKLIL